MIIWGKLFEVGAGKMCRSSPHSSAFSGLVRLSMLAAVARHFAPPKQTPWRCPCFQSNNATLDRKGVAERLRIPLKNYENMNCFSLSFSSTLSIADHQLK